MTVPPAAVIFLDHILDLATALKMVFFCRYTCDRTAGYKSMQTHWLALGASSAWAIPLDKAQAQRLGRKEPSVASP